MASIIRIKRSGTAAGAPSSLAQGELAYTWTNGVEKLFIGTGTETAGEAANVEAIGGAYYTGLVDVSTAGELTTSESSIPVLGSDGSIDKWLVGNLQLTGNTLSSTDTNGDINITPNGAGSIVLDGQYWPQTVGANNSFLKTDASGNLSWTAVPSGSFTLSDGSTTDVFTTGQTLTFTGGTGLTSSVSDNEITFEIDSSVVTLSDGQTLTNKTIDADDNSISNLEVDNFKASAIITAAEGISSNDVDTALPTASAVKDYVDTAVGNVTTDFTIEGDSGTDTFNTGETLTFSGDTGITTTVTNNTVTIDLDDTAVAAGSYGSTTEIPYFTVDSQGRLTDAGSNSISTSFTISNGSASDTFNNGETLTFTAGEGIDISVGSNEVTIEAELATDTNAGVASFDSTNFTVTSGAVTANDITIGTTSLTNGETTLTLAGLQSLEVDNLTIDGNAITASTGGITLVPAAGQHVSVNSATIQDVADPVNDTDAANKRYVDEVAQGLTTKPQVKAATTANLTATYTNGTAGVGATLTIAPTATLTIDGVSAWSQYDGILVKNQTNAFENGRYYVSTVGDALTDWVLTRCGYCDEASEIPGMYIFVTDGTVNANTGWAGTVDDPDTFTVGTDDIDFYQFSGAGSYTAGEGLTLTGTTFDVNLAANGGLEVISDELQIKSSIAGDGLTFNNGVVDVVGTSNRITVSSDSIDIASTYVGQSSITTVGTITSGTWNGTAIADAYVANDLTINGGTVDNTPIGSSTASSGAFTTLSSSGEATLASAIVSDLTSGRVTYAGTSGALQDSANLTFNGTTLTANALGVTNNATVGGTLGVTGNVTLSSNLTGSGSSVLSGFEIDGGTY